MKNKINSTVVAACVVRKMSLEKQKLEKRERKTPAETRHLATLNDVFEKVFGDKAPHVKNGRG